MKKLNIVFLFIFVNLILIHSVYGQSWVIQISNTPETINDIHFLDVNTGYGACTGGVVIKTTNGGTNWFVVGASLPTSLSRIRFFDANTGLTFGVSMVHKTTNGGINWSQVANYYSTDATIADNNTIYALGNSLPVKSIDRGGNWVNTAQTPPLVPSSICFINSQTGWTATIQSSTGVDFINIAKTTNGGSNWSNVFSRPGLNGASVVKRIFFLNEQKGYFIGKGNSSVEITTSGGSNWSTLLDNNFFYGLSFANETTGWVCGGAGLITKTTDGGGTWFYPPVPTSERLNCIQFVGLQTGWAAGFNGIILKSTNGGVTGVNQTGSEIPNEFSLSQNYPNPFNPVTKIKFSIPHVEVAFMRPVQLMVYDAIGKEVAVLVNQQLQPGTYEADWDASAFPSGVYYYKLEGGSFSDTKKMVLVK